MTEPLSPHYDDESKQVPAPEDVRADLPPPAERGRIAEVARIAAPVVLTQASISAMMMVDSAMVGRVGPAQLAAVGFGGIWLWTWLCFFLGLTSAIQTFVAQTDGAGERHRCGHWTWQGLYTMLPAAAVACLIAQVGTGPWFALLGTSDELHPLATDYTRARAWGAVGLCAAMCLSSFFRGLGDTRTPLYATLLANAVNASLDYALIFGHWGAPAMGVQGAGVATAVAEWVSCGYLVFAFTRERVRAKYATAAVPFHRGDAVRLLRVGAPVGGQWLLGMTSFATFSTLVAHMGEESMAASQAFLALLSLSFMQAIGISVAASTLVGRYIGARDWNAVEKSYRSSLLLALCLGLAVAVLFLAVPDHLMSLFSNDPIVLGLGGSLLLVGAVFQLFDAFCIVNDGALRGAGDTRWPFWIHFVFAWGLFLPAAYWLGVVQQHGLTGAWLGGLIQVVLLAAVLTQRFRSGAWRRITI
ncbi:MAG: MATE family efflux transporter [Proteobacteria bacterium]|nr:MATE family efflux transporter [Pseudomonadota bacterium]